MNIFEIIWSFFIFFLPIFICFGIPAAVLIWFIVSIVKYVRTPKDNCELRKKRRILLIISAVILSTMAAAFIALIIIFFMAMQHM